jgi:hypothetical protein
MMESKISSLVSENILPIVVREYDNITENTTPIIIPLKIRLFLAGKFLVAAAIIPIIIEISSTSRKHTIAIESINLFYN